MDRWMMDCGWVDGWMDGWMDGSTDEWMDGWVDGWMDGRTDGRIDQSIDRWVSAWMGAWMQEVISDGMGWDGRMDGSVAAGPTFPVASIDAERSIAICKVSLQP